MAGRDSPSTQRRPTAGALSRAMGAVASKARESEAGRNPKPMAVASGGLAARPVAPVLKKPVPQRKVVSRYGYA